MCSLLTNDHVVAHPRARRQRRLAGRVSADEGWHATSVSAAMHVGLRLRRCFEILDGFRVALLGALVSHAPLAPFGRSWDAAWGARRASGPLHLMHDHGTRGADAFRGRGLAGRLVA